MREPFHKQPIAAIALAAGAGVLAHKANANAAAVLHVKPVVVGLWLALLLALLAHLGI